MDRALRSIYSLSNFQICNAMLLTIVAMLYTTFSKFYFLHQFYWGIIYMQWNSPILSLHWILTNVCIHVTTTTIKIIYTYIIIYMYVLHGYSFTLKLSCLCRYFERILKKHMCALTHRDTHWWHSHNSCGDDAWIEQGDSPILKTECVHFFYF